MSRAKTTKTDATTGNGYWRQSMRPLLSLVFVIPMLVAYEAGVLWFAAEQPEVRNGVDVWLRGLLGQVGLGVHFLLPVLTCGILLAWHHMARHSWRVAPTVVAGMWVESTLLALLLVGIAQLQGRLFHLGGQAPAAAVAATGASPTSLLAYFGAGIYEELLFRLLLLPSVAALLRLTGASMRVSLVTAAVLTSVVFAAAHYQLFTSVGAPFDWFSFVFRSVAGMFFAALFLWRGFGIAAGTHALYDVLVVVG